MEVPRSLYSISRGVDTNKNALVTLIAVIIGGTKAHLMLTGLQTGKSNSTDSAGLSKILSDGGPPASPYRNLIIFHIGDLAGCVDNAQFHFHAPQAVLDQLMIPDYRRGIIHSQTGSLMRLAVFPSPAGVGQVASDATTLMVYWPSGTRAYPNPSSRRSLYPLSKNPWT